MYLLDETDQKLKLQSDPTALHQNQSICINLHKFRKDIHGKLIKSFFSDSDPISRPLKEKGMWYTPVNERHTSITLEVRRDTTDELATIPFHLVLFSAALVELTKSIRVRSLILSSHLFFSLPLFFLHHGVSRAEFSLTESIPLQAVYVDHSRNPQLLYGSPWSRTEGEVNGENKQLFFRQSATPVENSSNIYF